MKKVNSEESLSDHEEARDFERGEQKGQSVGKSFENYSPGQSISKG